MLAVVERGTDSVRERARGALSERGEREKSLPLASIGISSGLGLNEPLKFNIKLPLP